MAWLSRSSPDGQHGAPGRPARSSGGDGPASSVTTSISAPVARAASASGEPQGASQVAAARRTARWTRWPGLACPASATSLATTRAALGGRDDAHPTVGRQSRRGRRWPPRLAASGGRGARRSRTWWPTRRPPGPGRAPAPRVAPAPGARRRPRPAAARTAAGAAAAASGAGAARARSPRRPAPGAATGRWSSPSRSGRRSLSI